MVRIFKFIGKRLRKVNIELKEVSGSLKNKTQVRQAKNINIKYELHKLGEKYINTRGLSIFISKNS